MKRRTLANGPPNALSFRNPRPRRKQPLCQTGSANVNWPPLIHVFGLRLRPVGKGRGTRNEFSRVNRCNRISRHANLRSVRFVGHATVKVTHLQRVTLATAIQRVTSAVESSFAVGKLRRVTLGSSAQPAAPDPLAPPSHRNRPECS